MTRETEQRQKIASLLAAFCFERSTTERAHLGIQVRIHRPLFSCSSNRARATRSKCSLKHCFVCVKSTRLCSTTAAGMKASVVTSGILLRTRLAGVGWSLWNRTIKLLFVAIGSIQFIEN